MIWNNHFRDVPAGSHAPFGASKYAWLNYDEEKAISYFKALKAKERGIRLHELAKQCIENQVKLKGRNTLAMYVNDAIGFRMRPEQPLLYSRYFYGTADAICFRKGFLRIHDLKTGTTKARLDQLIIYDALFCLEYGVKPGEIEHELRIYQNDEILIGNPGAPDVLPVMDKIVRFDQLISELEEDDEA